MTLAETRIEAEKQKSEFLHRGFKTFYINFGLFGIKTAPRYLVTYQITPQLKDFHIEYQKAIYNQNTNNWFSNGKWLLNVNPSDESIMQSSNKWVLLGDNTNIYLQDFGVVYFDDNDINVCYSPIEGLKELDSELLSC